ncbi:MAG: cysteine hydrolase [Tagaea sp. CACIAM 22H2]|nr:cysteine hydrolase [Tagaea sp. CACIAM 22H2]
MTLPPTATLIVIDMQQAVDLPYWGPRCNPGAEMVVARLLAAWRARGLPVIHVRHDSVEPQSGYRPDRPSHAFKPEAMPLPGEAVIAKSTNSAFIGTDLERRLRDAKAAPVVFAGVATSNSVEATVRMAGNLGFHAWIVADGCFTFDKTLLDGRVIPAADVHALSLANLSGEYARVVNSAELLQAVSAG